MSRSAVQEGPRSFHSIPHNMIFNVLHCILGSPINARQWIFQKLSYQRMDAPFDAPDPSLGVFDQHATRVLRLIRNLPSVQDIILQFLYHLDGVEIDALTMEYFDLMVPSLTHACNMYFSSILPVYPLLAPGSASIMQQLFDIMRPRERRGVQSLLSSRGPIPPSSGYSRLERVVAQRYLLSGENEKTLFNGLCMLVSDRDSSLLPGSYTSLAILDKHFLQHLLDHDDLRCTLIQYAMPPHAI